MKGLKEGSKKTKGLKEGPKKKKGLKEGPKKKMGLREEDGAQRRGGRACGKTCPKKKGWVEGARRSA